MSSFVLAKKQTRTWGTRFSPLVPPSPGAQSVGASDPFPASPAAPASPSLPESPPPRVQMPAATVQPNDDVPLVPYQHLPHDASVFVASLPSHLGEQELRRALFDTFSAHRQIRHVKVIGPDARGAVCAFVQANNSEDAASLIEKFHLSYFHGRPIRCEKARALRTLFISYQRPAPPATPDALAMPLAGGAGVQDLPRTLRLRREKDARYVHVLYDEEANTFDVSDPINNASYPTPYDPFSYTGVYLAPLKFDEDTLYTLCKSFGAIEHMKQADIPDHQSPPAPHDGAREANMFPHIMQIKWEHRNDAVSAYNLFSNIPFLAVSWAHSHPFHPDATPARPPVTRFGATRNVGTSIGSALSELRPQDDPPRSQTTSPAQVATGLPLPTDQFARPIIPFSGITEHDFPPLSSRRPKHLDGAWVKTLKLQGTFGNDAGSRNGIRIEGEASESESRRSTPPLVSPTDDEPPTPSSLVPPTPLVAEFQFNHPDPHTLFVGGIATNRPPAWDEDKIRDFYSRYGVVEDVKLVKPVSKPVGFAFVRYADEESTTQAIADHINRDHEGQQIKVKVKDSGPGYRGWLPRNRGRGRGGFRRFAPASASHYNLNAGLRDMHVSEAHEPVPSPKPQQMQELEGSAPPDAAHKPPPLDMRRLTHASGPFPEFHPHHIHVRDADSTTDDYSDESSVNIHMGHSSLYTQYTGLSTPASSVVEVPHSQPPSTTTPRPPSAAPSSQHNAQLMAQPPLHPLFYPYPCAPVAYLPAPQTRTETGAPAGEAWHAAQAPWAMMPQPMVCYDQNGMLVPYYPPPVYTRPPPHQQASGMGNVVHNGSPPNPSYAAPGMQHASMQWQSPLYAPVPPMWMGMLPPNANAGSANQSSSTAMPQAPQPARGQFANGRGGHANKALPRAAQANGVPRQMRGGAPANVDQQAAYLPPYAEHAFQGGLAPAPPFAIHAMQQAIMHQQAAAARFAHGAPGASAPPQW